MTGLDQKKLSWIFWPLVIFLLSGIIIARRPDALAHPQFWAEDGRVWYAQAYQYGAASIVKIQDGYFQTLARLAAASSQFVPMERAPLVFNLAAFIIELLACLFIVSGRRLRGLIPSAWLRALLALWLAALPNTAELHLNLTNAQWYLALLMLCVLVADIPKTRAWKIFDCGTLILGGLSGPFAILFFPTAAIRYWKLRDIWSKIYLALVGACAAVQVAALAATYGSRPHTPVVLSTRLFFATLNRQVFMGLALGARGYLWVLQHSPHYFWIFSATTVLSLVLCVYAFWKSHWRLRTILLTGGMFFVAGLINPTVYPGALSAMKVLSLSYAGARYWLIPMLAFAGALIFCAAQNRHKIVRAVAAVVICAGIAGIIFDFNDKPFADFHFSDYAARFKNLPPHATIKIPINPPGWDMELTKK